MSETVYTIKESTLVNIANEIRAKTETTDKENPLDMPALIRSIVSGGGIVPTGTIEITENGEKNVRVYEYANVNVPQGVFPSGTLEITENGEKTVTTYDKVNVDVPQGVFPSGTLEITENGEKTVTTYDKVNVDVPQGVFPSGTLDITSNNDYNVREYERVHVDVPTGITPTGTIELTENGTFDVTQFASALVNVAGSSGVEVVEVTHSSSAHVFIPTEKKLTEINHMCVISTSGYPLVSSGTRYVVMAQFFPTSRKLSVTGSEYHAIAWANNWGNGSYMTFTDQVLLEIEGGLECTLPFNVGTYLFFIV